MPELNERQGRSALLRALPSVVSLARIALLVPIWLAMLVPMQLGYATAFIIYAIAALTDLFDGFLARRLGAVTNFGITLDTIADKVLVLGVLLNLALHQHLTELALAAFAVIAAREIIVTALRLISYGHGLVIESSLLAKSKTVCQMSGVGALLAVPFMPMLNDIGTWILALAAALSVLSAIQYLRRRRT